MMAALLLSLLVPTTATRSPLLLRVDPTAQQPGGSGGGDAAVVGTLSAAAARVASLLAAVGSVDVVVELADGPHRVPPGGLRLSLEHTPAEQGHAVVWRCASGAGSCTVHGGEPVTGWKPCGSSAGGDGCLGDGVWMAALPAALKGKRLRHMFVDGVRANRTRTNAAAYGLRYQSGPGVGDDGGDKAPHPAAGCAGDFGEKVGQKVCCGQSGTIGHAADICPSSAPYCHGFVQHRCVKPMDWLQFRGRGGGTRDGLCHHQPRCGDSF
jgi:hypothetical protein